MPRIRAFIVEDDHDQVIRHERFLESMGVQCTTFYDASSVRDHKEADALIDLIILDRRLPYTAGSSDDDEIGDDLLEHLIQNYPDSAFFVFTGKADAASAGQAMNRRHRIDGGRGFSVNAVQHFEKRDAIKFQQSVEVLVGQLNKIQTIELVGEKVDNLDQRVLRRVGFELQGQSVKAEMLDEGQSGSKVWQCTIFSGAAVVGAVVVKYSSKPPKGIILQSLLPASVAVARPTMTITGLMGSQIAVVTPFAGVILGSIFDFAKIDPPAAAAQLKALRLFLDPLQPSQSEVTSLSTVVTPFRSWPEISHDIDKLGFHVQDLSLTTRVFAQHGDLRGGNVLITDSGPVIIDLDSQALASGLVDPVAMIFGSMFNCGSPFRGGGWPTIDQVLAMPAPLPGTIWDAITTSPAYEFFVEAWSWLQFRMNSEREFWALLLSFGLRQLKYPDIASDQALKLIADALVQRALEQLE